MVDFQERDTQRGFGSDENDDGDGGESADDHGDHGDHRSHEDSEHSGHDNDDGHSHSHDSHDHGHSDHAHDHHAHDVEELGFGVVTVSTSRTLDDDPSGDAIAELVEDAGNRVVTRELVNDEYDRVQSIVNALVGRGDVDVVVTTGGTGVTPDDVTVEAVRPLLDTDLPGFGELFRRLSYDEIGTKVVGTRALAGISNGVPVFCLPGSENAVRLGVDEIIVPEAGHLAGLARRDEEDGSDEDDETEGSESSDVTEE